MREAELKLTEQEIRLPEATLEKIYYGTRFYLSKLGLNSGFAGHLRGAFFEEACYEYLAPRYANEGRELLSPDATHQYYRGIYLDADVQRDPLRETIDSLVTFDGLVFLEGRVVEFVEYTTKGYDGRKFKKKWKGFQQQKKDLIATQSATLAYITPLDVHNNDNDNSPFAKPSIIGKKASFVKVPFTSTGIKKAVAEFINDYRPKKDEYQTGEYPTIREVIIGFLPPGVKINV